MLKKQILLILITLSALLSGCASVPMASVAEDNEKKQFRLPSKDTAGLYIFRDTSLGAALKKSIYIDGNLIGETAANTYFYRDIKPGQHKLSTESEFGENDLAFNFEGGKNHFIRQYIKMGLFVGGAGLENVSESEGKNAVLQCDLAK